MIYCDNFLSSFYVMSFCWVFDNRIIIFSSVLNFMVVGGTICSMWLESTIIFIDFVWESSVGKTSE